MDVDAISRSITMEDSSSKTEKAISLSHTNKTSHLTTSKKKNRKGGLSMFLSGALDDAPRHAPLPMPKNEGPAWGGAKFTHTSLRDIQNEQSKTKEIIPMRSKGGCEDPTDPANSGKVRLGSFLPNISSPIVIVPAEGVAGPDAEKSTPPWSSSGTSPGLNRPSLRDIQLQQVWDIIKVILQIITILIYANYDSGLFILTMDLIVVTWFWVVIYNIYFLHIVSH